MKKLILSVPFLLLCLLSFGQNSEPEFVWAVQAGSETEDWGLSIDNDSNGNSYVTGHFGDTATFGNTTETSAGGTDVFVSKLDNDGNFLWTKRAGGQYDERSWDIATDDSGNSYITGFYRGNADFGNFTLNGGNQNKFFVAKLDTNGNFIWVKDADLEISSGGTRIVEKNGQIYIIGSFHGTFKFDDEIIETEHNSDSFFMKINSNGELQWLKHGQFDFAGSILGLDADDYGNLFLSGNYTGSFTIDNFELDNNTEGSDVLFAKLDSSGNVLWLKSSHDSTVGSIRNIAVDSNNDFIISGLFSNSITIEDSTLETTPDLNGLLIKLNSDGELQWMKKIESENMIDLHSICTDNSGNSFVSGFFSQHANFDGTEIFSSYMQEILVFKINAAGEYVWIRKSDDNAPNGGWARNAFGISTDNSGYLFLTGTFRNQFQLGDTVLESLDYNGDIFITKLSDANMGIPEPLNHEEIKIYPNPVKDLISIESKNKISTVSIIDLSGKLIQKKIVNSTKTQFNTNNLTKGVYVIEITNDKGQKISKKIIKK